MVSRISEYAPKLWIYAQQHHPELFEQACNEKRDTAWLRRMVKRTRHYRVVYFFSCSQLHVVKVGMTWSHRFKQRLREVQTGCPAQIDAFTVIPACQLFNETNAHAILKPYNTYGEWYDNSTGRVDVLINEWLAMYEAKSRPNECQTIGAPQ